MKKCLANTFFLLCVFLFNAFAVSAYGTGRTGGMGGIGTSAMETDISYFTNPASVYYYKQKKKFLLEMYYYDTHSSSNPYVIERPDTGFKAQFVGKGVALSFGLDKYVTEFSKENLPDRLYTFRRRFDLSVSFATGYKNFAFGAGIYGGSFARRSGVNIGSRSYFGDFIKNMFFSEFARDSNEEFVSIELGGMYNLDHLTFSIKSDELLSYNASDKNELTFKNSLETLGGAVYYCSDFYAKRGHLNKWVFSAGVEAKNLFSDTDRSLHLGAEAVYQLARNYNIAGRAGYYTATKDLSEGVVTMGIGSRINLFDVSVSVNVPLACFKDSGDSYTVGINVIYVI